MEFPSVLRSVPATPDYVLRVLQDQHRHRVAVGDWVTPCEITGDMPIAEWIGWFDCPEAREDLADRLNEAWSIEATDWEWCATLNPSKQKTVGDVCELIAKHAKRPIFKTPLIAGMRSRPAGAFLAIRELLGRNGIDVSGIAPSTPLREYTRRNTELFFGEIVMLAPGALPFATFERPPDTWMVEIRCLVWLCSLLSFFIAQGVHRIAILIALVFELASIFVSQEWRYYVRFAGLETFRDLACAISEQNEYGIAP